MGRDDGEDFRCFDCELNIGRPGLCPDCEAERERELRDAAALRRHRKHEALVLQDMRDGKAPHPHMGGECVTWADAARISADGV